MPKVHQKPGGSTDVAIRSAVAPFQVEKRTEESRHRQKVFHARCDSSGEAVFTIAGNDFNMVSV
jgi:hypothetical protein